MTTCISLYLHIPFCLTRCSYCAFNTYTGQMALIPTYVEMLRRELSFAASHLPAHHVINTIYFGGGTPSLLPVQAVATILNHCATAFAWLSEVEITFEINPGTIDAHYLATLRQTGVNRISIGMQSAHDAELALIARRHSIADVQHTVQAARTAGFDSLSLDLIYGIPRQTSPMWRQSLETAITLNPDHLSLYSLSVENATPLEHQIARGTLPMPDDDQAADMIEWATARLDQAGFQQYEISNWAKPGFACQHNVHVWRNLPYLGIGAGAHGCAAGVRYANVLHPTDYITRLQEAPESDAARPFPLTPAADEIEQLGDADIMSDTMILGLRLTQEGIAAGDFHARFGRDLWAIYGAELDRLIAQGLLERITTSDPTQDRVRLTPRGRLLGNHVFAAFV
ncbi:MAG: radical SAM family heme chaperone HemW [Anaerolineae bacterium]|nr:radical SAM family heme chaperone HemW [Anaerolineae bacterium]